MIIGMQMMPGTKMTSKMLNLPYVTMSGSSDDKRNAWTFNIRETSAENGWTENGELENGY